MCAPWAWPGQGLAGCRRVGGGEGNTSARPMPKLHQMEGRRGARGCARREGVRAACEVHALAGAAGTRPRRPAGNPHGYWVCARSGGGSKWRTGGGPGADRRNSRERVSELPSFPSYLYRVGLAAGQQLDAVHQLGAPRRARSYGGRGGEISRRTPAGTARLAKFLCPQVSGKGFCPGCPGLVHGSLLGSPNTGHSRARCPRVGRIAHRVVTCGVVTG